MSEPADPHVQALRDLPRAHALALQLRDAGLADDLIAERLDIEPESVRPLLAVAEAKLASALKKHGP